MLPLELRTCLPPHPLASSQIPILCPKAHLSPSLPCGPGYLIPPTVPRLPFMCAHPVTQLAPSCLEAGPKAGLWSLALARVCPLSPCPARTVWLVPISSWRPQKKKAERWSAVGRLADCGSPGRPGRACFHRTAPVLRSRNTIWEGGGQHGGGRSQVGLHRPTGPSQASPEGAAPQGHPGYLAKAPLLLAQPASTAPSAVPTNVPQLRTTVGPQRGCSQPVCQCRFRFQ